MQRRMRVPGVILFSKYRPVGVAVMAASFGVGCSAGQGLSPVITTTTVPANTSAPAGAVVITCAGDQVYTGTVTTSNQQQSPISIAGTLGAPAGATLGAAAITSGLCTFVGTYTTGLAVNGRVADGTVDPVTGAFTGEVQTALANGCLARKTYTGTLTDTVVAWVPGADINNCNGASPLTFSVAATAPPRTTTTTTTTVPGNAPVITSVAPAPPSAIPAGIGNTSIDVWGLNFGASSVVQWNGTALVTAVLQADRLRAQVPAALVASPGSASVTVVNPGNLASNAVTVNVTANLTAVPVITSVSPVDIAVNIRPSGEIIDVDGLNFGATSVVQWNGTNLATTLVQPGRLQAQVPAALIASPSSPRVTVVNPGSPPSNAVTLNVTTGPIIRYAAPEPPSAIPARIGNTSIDVWCNNCDSTSVVVWDSTALVTAEIGSGRLRAQVPAALVASPRSASVTIVNPGSRRSNAVTVLVR